MILSELAPLVSAQHGVFYSMTTPRRRRRAACCSSRPATATRSASTSPRPSGLGEGLVGQCAKEKKRILLTEVPGDYVRINSGLGVAPPLNIIVLPVLFEGSVRAVVELASFSPLQRHPPGLPRPDHREHRPRPEHDRGQHPHREPARAVPVPGRGAALPAGGAARVERGPRAPGRAARRAEHRGGAEEPGGRGVQAARRGEGRPARRLVEVQVRVHRQHVPRAAHAAQQPADPRRAARGQPRRQHDRDAGRVRERHPLVRAATCSTLLNSILDLAKVESGTVKREHVRRSRSRSCAPRCCASSSTSRTTKDARLLDRPRARTARTSIVTDPQRLRQILKNLLVQRVQVHRARRGARLRSASPTSGWTRVDRVADSAPSVLAFAVSDTGIGIDDEQQHTDLRGVRPGRRHAPLALYGGTGLGLSISRELVGLLGGEITVVSAPGEGSTSPSTSRSAPRPQQSVTPHGRRLERRARPPRPRSSPLSGHAAPRSGPRRARPGRSEDFAGTKVLVVDDDFRNIFAMTALLERGNAEVIVAESGPDALAILAATTGHRHRADGHHDAGHGRLRRRSARSGRSSEFKSLPIVAVTGKVDARRAPALPRRRRQRLRAQAGRHRRAARRAAAVAAGRDGAGMSPAATAARMRADEVPEPRAPVPILIVDDNAGQAPGAEGRAGAARLRHRRGRLGRRRAALPHGRGLRRHPARRADAEHGRLRDRRPHPPAPAVRDDADHLHHRVRAATRCRTATATPKGRSTSSSRPCRPDELRAKVSVFANLFLQARGRSPREARELQASADQLRLLTDAAPIGIFQTDADNRYVYTNPRWIEITGVPAPSGDRPDVGGDHRSRARRARAAGRRRHGSGRARAIGSRSSCPGSARGSLLVTSQADPRRRRRGRAAGSGRWPTSPPRSAPRRRCPPPATRRPRPRG